MVTEWTGYLQCEALLGLTGLQLPSFKLSPRRAYELLWAFPDDFFPRKKWLQSSVSWNLYTEYF